MKLEDAKTIVIKKPKRHIKINDFDPPYKIAVSEVYKKRKGIKESKALKVEKAGAFLK